MYIQPTNESLFSVVRVCACVLKWGIMDTSIKNERERDHHPTNKLVDKEPRTFISKSNSGADAPVLLIPIARR